MAEQTKDQLQAQIAQLTQDLATATAGKDELSKRVDALSDALANANQDKVELQGQLTDERTRSGEAAGELNEAQNLIEELQAKLATAEAVQAESNVAIVSDGTDSYRLLAPRFHYQHQLYTAAELKASPELVAELVAAEVGFLVKIEVKQ